MESYRNRSGDVVIEEHFLDEDVFVTATNQHVTRPVSLYMLQSECHVMTTEEARWLGAALIKSANLAEGAQE